MIFVLSGGGLVDVTSLAKEFACSAGIDFVGISIEALRREFNVFRLKGCCPFDELMEIQEYILDQVDGICDAQYGVDTISNCSPVDCLFDTLLKIRFPITFSQRQRLLSYIKKCLSIAELHCVGVVLIRQSFNVVNFTRSDDLLGLWWKQVVGFNQNTILFSELIWVEDCLSESVADLKKILYKSIQYNLKNEREFTWKLR